MEHDSLSFFQGKLKKWFKEKGRNFPWRAGTATCYERVVSEILLQRTKAETINKYYSTFIKRFPNWESIKSASQNDLENFLKPIGLAKDL